MSRAAAATEPRPAPAGQGITIRRERNGWSGTLAVRDLLTVRPRGRTRVGRESSPSWNQSLPPRRLEAAAATAPCDPPSGQLPSSQRGPWLPPIFRGQDGQCCSHRFLPRHREAWPGLGAQIIQVTGNQLPPGLTQPAALTFSQTLPRTADKEQTDACRQMPAGLPCTGRCEGATMGPEGGPEASRGRNTQPGADAPWLSFYSKTTSLCGLGGLGTGPERFGFQFLLDGVRGQDRDRVRVGGGH